MASIDTTFDFRSGLPEGRDPDSHSQILYSYHQKLWSKPLPSGELLSVSPTTSRPYQMLCTNLGGLPLSSDTVIPSFRRYKDMAHIRSQLEPNELEDFVRLGYTIGGMMIFPSKQIDRQMTINGARGCHRQIRDRFDLTVECIRRHYIGQPSPLSDCLARYAPFFDLFGDFEGYVRFFFLEDLVTKDFSAIRFSQPFDNFQSSPLPVDLNAYRQYKANCSVFVDARNQRIKSWVSSSAS